MSTVTPQRVPARARALLAVTLSLFALGWASAARADDYPHLLLGNPSDAKEDPRDQDNYLMKKPFFALSYNNSRGTPNWVSGRLTKDDLGEAPRKPMFDPDNTLPRGFHRVTHKDYTGSGFDRGVRRDS
jgi:endonuclease G